MILGKNIHYRLRFDFQVFPRPSGKHRSIINYPEDYAYRNLQLQVWLAVNDTIMNEIETPITIPLTTFFDLTPP